MGCGEEGGIRDRKEGREGGELRIGREGEGRREGG